MSAVQQLLVAGRAPITVSGTVYGSGSLAIPAGVTSVSLTGQGGTGTTNYNPGQAYIAPSSGYQVYTSDAYYSGYNSNFLVAPYQIDATAQTIDVQIRYESNRPWNYLTLTRKTGSKFAATGGMPGYPDSYYFVDDPSNIGTAIVYYSWEVYGATAGQSYIAPYYTYTTGPSTTFGSLTWSGGYGGAATQSTQTLTPNASGQSISYSIGSGGNLSYSYIA